MTDEDDQVGGPLKTEPTVFPYGFGLNKIDESIIVIDFLDTDSPSGRNRVISSVAMPRKRAELMAKAILEIDDEAE